ncbi:MAG: acylphosphatase [Gammaproteobacteria bacterium]|nr:acylphosphatase [Gammaproteobacteria bacterium]
MSCCLRCRVSGRVQGVWFRDSTRRQAERLGLRGSARNLADGSVEVVACGEEAALQALRDWLWQGPRDARVTAVQCEPLSPAEVPAGFTIG